MSSILDPTSLIARFDPAKGATDDAPLTKRYLADLRGCFCDAAAFDRALAQDNSLVYTVSAVEPAAGEGDLHYGLGTIYPGRVGQEYFLTKGHLHTWRAAAEVYIGLAGQGAMLLEDEASGENCLVPLQANSVVYVPGHTAHRTVNTGDVALVYIGVYPARAGHDYGAIAERNFRSIVVERDGKPCMLRREP
jgi:glucose-6-phosphate isomerase, archaeal